MNAMYKKGLDKNCFPNLFSDGRKETIISDEITLQCFEAINNLKKKYEADSPDVSNYLEYLSSFIMEHVRLIDPVIFIKSGFVEVVYKHFIEPDIETYSFFTVILHQITEHELICENIVQNMTIDIMSACAEKIKNTPNVQKSDEIFGIATNMLKSYLANDLHEEAELHIGSFRTTSAYFSLLKFVVRLLQCVEYSVFPQKYVSILFDIIENMDFEEKVEEYLHYIYFSLYFLAKGDKSNLSLIIEKIKNRNISLFGSINRYLEPETHFNCSRVMYPFLIFIQFVFNLDRVENSVYQKILMQELDFSFFMTIIIQTEDAKVRIAAMRCLLTELQSEIYQNSQTLQNFRNIDNNYNFFIEMIKSATFVEKLFAFNILTVLIHRNQQFIQFYNLGYLEIIIGFVNLDPTTVLLFVYCMLKVFEECGNAVEVAMKVDEIGFLGEATEIYRQKEKECNDESLFQWIEKVQNELNFILSEKND